MKIYRVHMDGDFGAADSEGIWFTRKADAPKVARELKSNLCEDENTHPEPILEEFDVPAKKSELVAFLNVWCNR